MLCSTSTEVTLFSSHGFSIGRGSSQHTTRRHEGGGGGDASARHRCGLFVAGATRRHALGDTRRGGRPGAHPAPIARPRLSARIDPTFSRHPPLTLRPLSRSTGLPRRGGGDHDGRRHRHRCPRARHELAGGRLVEARRPNHERGPVQESRPGQGRGGHQGDHRLGDHGPDAGKQTGGCVQAHGRGDAGSEAARAAGEGPAEAHAGGDGDAGTRAARDDARHNRTIQRSRRVQPEGPVEDRGVRVVELPRHNQGMVRPSHRPRVHRARRGGDGRSDLRGVGAARVQSRRSRGEPE